MGTSRLTFVPDVSVGEWIAPRLGPFGGRVSSVVPAGFAAYARVLHPVGDETLSSETWVDVCAVADRQPHALMQWDSISIPHIPDGSRAVSSGAPWDGEPPRIGDLAPIAMAALCRVLASHTDSDVDIYFGVWEGWGWLARIFAQRIGPLSGRAAGPGWGQRYSKWRVRLPHQGMVVSGRSACRRTGE